MGLSVFLVVTLLAATCFAAPPTVKSVDVVGNQTDSHIKPTTLFRDGGCVGTLGGKIVWFWSDTTYINSDGNFAGFYGNTGAIGDPNNMLNMTGPQRQAIPFTAAESSFNDAHSYNPRVVLWPKSQVIETSAGKGYLWVPKGYWGSTSDPTPNAGIVLSTVVIGSDGFPSVTRLSDVPLFPEGKTPLFGGFAAARDSRFVYLYSSDSIGAWTAATFIARVPLASASNITKYQYYNSQTKTWGSTIPSLSDSGQAIFNTTFGVDGSVYYSSYYQTWIMIFNYRADAIVFMRTASKPEGPWSADTLMYKPPTPPDPNVSYIYGTTGTPLYDATGQSVSIDFTWYYPGGYANWDVKVSFN